MKKLNFILIFGILFFSFGLISAQSVCCEKTTSGAWCQFVDQTQCASSNAAFTSCDQTSYCQAGTCMDTDSGTCMPNTPKATCENSGGFWDSREKHQIPDCQQGCCIVGDEVAFVNNIECKQIGTHYGVNATFRQDIKDELTCYANAKTTVKGACVLDSSGVRNCKINTKAECASMNGKFNEGFLCTAGFLSTTCAKTGNTVCGNDGKVYFLDSCGNRANVYDENMFSLNSASWTPVMEDYWIKIKEPECSVGSNTASSECGNCNYVGGTTCAKYISNSAGGMPSSAPQFGDYVCRELSCYYDTNLDGKIDPETEHYAQGERWCAFSGADLSKAQGTFPGILVNSSTGALDPDVKKELLNNYGKYNLPGSRYYTLTCIDGEVVVEPCADFRNEICVETITSAGYKNAQCKINNWKECVTLGNKNECENGKYDCKWLPGYRFDLENKNTNTQPTQGNPSQGSCVPLFAPGFDFWKPNNAGSAFCKLANVLEAVKYETNQIFERAERASSLEVGLVIAAENCYDNCYAIPGYGDQTGASTVQKIHEGDAKITSDTSNRKGYYCVNDNTGKQSVGPSSGTVSCAEDDKGRNVRRQYPVFFTNEQWLNFLIERARSLGDCGYKTNFEGEYGNEEGEMIYSIYSKLEGRKDFEAQIKEAASNLEDPTSGREIIYKGDRWDMQKFKESSFEYFLSRLRKLP